MCRVAWVATAETKASRAVTDAGESRVNHDEPQVGDRCSRQPALHAAPPHPRTPRDHTPPSSNLIFAHMHRNLRVLCWRVIELLLPKLRKTAYM